MNPTTILTRTAALGLVGAVAAIAAGAASAAPTAKTDPCLTPPAKFGKPTSERGSIWVEYCGVCHDTGWKEIKRSYRFKGTTPAAIALQYAQFDHYGSVLPPAKQGCQKGFALRGKP